MVHYELAIYPLTRWADRYLPSPDELTIISPSLDELTIISSSQMN